MHRAICRLAASACLLAGAAVGTPAATAAVPQMLLESIDPAGEPGDGASGSSAVREAALSEDGRFLVFTSEAANLVAGDTNGAQDVFVRDRLRGRTTRVSVRGPGGRPLDGAGSPAVSRGGRYVAFAASAPGSSAGSAVFLHDRADGQTTRVSTGVRTRHGGRVSSLLPAVSGSGRFVAFVAVERIAVGDEAETEPLGVFVHDRRSGATARLGPADTGRPALSQDGRLVAFATRARLVAGDRNRLPDAYVVDRRSGRATLVSVSSGGRRANRGVGEPVLSADGSVVAFESTATTLAPGAGGRASKVFVRDLRRRRTSLASVGPDGARLRGDATAPAVSGDGRVVAFQLSPVNGPIGDIDGPIGRVFIRDLARSTTTSAATAPSGRSGFPAVSADGRHVAFVSADPLLPSDANGVMDVYSCGPLD